ncbi:hypothetical protein M9H77_32340 [Catharanthus roseus]|uniref:Uncharacterized protein n=1 Tax=Catharanthus roseus TaxID=4058 RepID=A0ACC0A2P3_CATRO|nr:hypothetical protein M9H77_32340 [Catharanthus roseus]
MRTRQCICLSFSTLLPVPETRIGDLTVSIPSRRLKSGNFVENTFVAIRNEAYMAIFDNVFSQVIKEPIPTFRGFLINNCKSKWEQLPGLQDLQGLGEFVTLLLPGHCHHLIQID